jgi:hypothetical protein
MRRTSMLAGRILLGLVLIAGMAASTARAGEAADADLSILRESIRANRKAVVAASLTLSDTEAEQFWPLYDRYEKDVTSVNDRLVAIIKDYTASFHELSDEHATALVDQYLSVEEDRLKVRRTYLPEFAKALNGRKAARFFQIENKLDAIQKYDLAATIPVVEEK